MRNCGNFLRALLHQVRQMITQYDRRGADADVLCLSALQLDLQCFQLGEERLDEFEKLVARGCQCQRAGDENSATPRCSSSAATCPLMAGCWMP